MENTSTIFDADAVLNIQAQQAQQEPGPAVFGLNNTPLEVIEAAAAPADTPAHAVTVTAAPQGLGKFAPACPDAANAAALVFDERWQKFAHSIRTSHFLPRELRSTQDYDSTGDILMFIATAISYGLDPIASLFNKTLYVMPDRNGGFNVGMWTTAKIALATKCGCQVHTSFDPATATATCKVIRNGVEFVGTFSAEEAVIAKKMYKDSEGNYHGDVKTAWGAYWPTMLMRRAQSRALEQAAPDVLMGITSAEELQEIAATEPQVVRVIAAANTDLPKVNKIN